jgi:hypothetical protein
MHAAPDDAENPRPGQTLCPGGTNGAADTTTILSPVEGPTHGATETNRREHQVLSVVEGLSDSHRSRQ